MRLVVGIGLRAMLVMSQLFHLLYLICTMQILLGLFNLKEMAYWFSLWTFLAGSPAILYRMLVFKGRHGGGWKSRGMWCDMSLGALYIWLFIGIYMLLGSE
jgi:hypothetical protein